MISTLASLSMGISVRIRLTRSPGDFRISGPSGRPWAVWIRTWIPRESLRASPPRSSVMSPPRAISRSRASESIPTFDASSSPIRRNPRGSSIRSTWRSIGPPTEPVSTGVRSHGPGGRCKTAGPEAEHEDRDVVARLLLAEVEHRLLDPPRDGVGVQANQLLEQVRQALLPEDLAALALLGHAVGVEDDRVAGLKLREVVPQVDVGEHPQQVPQAVGSLDLAGRSHDERRRVAPARNRQLRPSVDELDPGQPHRGEPVRALLEDRGVERPEDPARVALERSRGLDRVPGQAGHGGGLGALALDVAD